MAVAVAAAAAAVYSGSSWTTAFGVSGLQVCMGLPGFEVDVKVNQVHLHRLMISAGGTFLLLGMPLLLDDAAITDVASPGT